MIEPFVYFLNLDEGANFQHVRCLDVWERNVPSPEILYADPETGARLAIERKAIVWPPDFAKNHRAYHYLMDSVSKELAEFCETRPVTVELPALEEFDRKEFRDLASVVGRAMRDNVAILESGGLSFEVGPGRFRVTPGFEIDVHGTPASSGIGFRFGLTSEETAERPSANNLPAKIPLMLNKAFSSCARKFRQFDDVRCALLFDPCGALWLIDVDWWKEVLRNKRPSDCIDEIWLVFADEDAVGQDYWSIDLLYSKRFGTDVERSGRIGFEEVKPLGKSSDCGIEAES